MISALRRAYATATFSLAIHPKDFCAAETALRAAESTDRTAWRAGRALVTGWRLVVPQSLKVARLGLESLKAALLAPPAPPVKKSGFLRSATICFARFVSGHRVALSSLGMWRPSRGYAFERRPPLYGLNRVCEA